MLNAIADLLWFILSIVLGGYILFFGRRALWATLGIVLLVVTSNLLAEFVAGGASAKDLFDSQEWLLLGIAIAAGLLGVLLGRVRAEIAALLIGFLAGADLVLWLYDISNYLITSVANLSDQVALVIGLALIVLGGIVGIWFVRAYQVEALILVAVLVGTEIAFRGSGLKADSVWTAIILLSLALSGIVVQYADYLRELKGQTPLAQYRRIGHMSGSQD